MILEFENDDNKVNDLFLFLEMSTINCLLPIAYLPAFFTSSFTFRDTPQYLSLFSCANFPKAHQTN